MNMILSYSRMQWHERHLPAGMQACQELGWQNLRCRFIKYLHIGGGR